MEQIEYHYEHKYGNRLCYVSNDAQARAIMTLTRRATITSEDISALTALGHTLVHVPLN